MKQKLKFEYTDTGNCVGSVVMLNNCENVVIDNCDLYGCGVDGINAYQVCNMEVINTCIHDCSRSALWLEETSGDVHFKDCSFYNNTFGFSYWSDNPMVLEHCSLGKSESEYVMFHEIIELIDCELTELDDEGEWNYPDIEEDYEYYPLEDQTSISFNSKVLEDSVWSVIYCEGDTCKNLLNIDDTKLIFDKDGKHCTLTGFLDGKNLEMFIEYDSSGNAANLYENINNKFPDGYIYLYTDLNLEESNLTMEHDGRGRIVFFSYVREEDYALVNDEFKSLVYQYLNDSPSVPMMKMNPGVDISRGMMGGMMARMKTGMTVAVPNQATQVEPWDCTCGNKQVTSKFCPECGLPMSK